MNFSVGEELTLGTPFQRDGASRGLIAEGMAAELRREVELNDDLSESSSAAGVAAGVAEEVFKQEQRQRDGQIGGPYDRVMGTNYKGFNDGASGMGVFGPGLAAGPKFGISQPGLMDPPFSAQMYDTKGIAEFGRNSRDSFNLPVELQGGVGTISSRRPSYAAESFTRSSAPVAPGVAGEFQGVPGFSVNQGLDHPTAAANVPLDRHFFKSTGGAPERSSLSAFAVANNYQNSHGFDLGPFSNHFAKLNLNANFNDFQCRRPSQLAEYQSANSFGPAPLPNQMNFEQLPQQNNLHPSVIKLENGLVLRGQYIVASPDLKKLYAKTEKYFHSRETSESIIQQLRSLLGNPVIIKLITFIKNLNNLTFNHKILCLVVNKNGKFDLLSYPNNSNMFLQKNDLVIVDGDRGKDLVMILEPLVDINFAALFNILKKLEHLKSLTIVDNSLLNAQQAQQKGSKKTCGGTHSTDLNASAIVNSHSNEDNEFIITFPTKQVLRFATPKEVHKLSGKFLEEKKAFTTCFNKIKELNLNNDLELINVEYQSDFKKLIFYYFAGFKRIDFRCLIKELFKIYKTRIWLCAVLPYDKPQLYVTGEDVDSSNALNDAKNKASESNDKSDNAGDFTIKGHIPQEYELSNEQILNFSIDEIEKLAEPSYFHLKNLANLIRSLSNDIKGNFYGFNSKDPNEFTQADPVNANVNTNVNADFSQGFRPIGLNPVVNVPQNGGIFDNDLHPGLSKTNILPNFNPFGDDKSSFQIRK